MLGVSIVMLHKVTAESRVLIGLDKVPSDNPKLLFGGATDTVSWR